MLLASGFPTRMDIATSLRQVTTKLTTKAKRRYTADQLEAQNELRSLLLAVEAHESIQNFQTRDRLITQSVATAQHAGFQSGFRKVGDIEPGKVKEVVSRKMPDWAGDVIAYIVLPQGQIAYFMSNVDMVMHDGHSREEKLQRINGFVTQ